ncbi:crossover junction endodeoxyribonuclease RuvC [Cellulomonas sp. P22]|uniref:crossover junction endodeoxyribonuclease RuvC n=1 Tax=Cellulomonas sp. P22 TaxID=3373189 RepID=UPI0037A3B697
MRVLGVDPGLTRCGLGVVDGLAGRRVRLVAVGVARSDASHEVDQRLLAIALQLDEWIEEHAPDTVAIERVFAQHNLSTVMGTAQVAGVAMLAAARRRIPVALHTPSEVKAAVTGNGRAEKAQVQAMVQRLLSLDELPRPADAADALALAICHLWRPAGALGSPQRAPGSLTSAQRAWAAAEQAARRGGRP